MAHFGFWVRCVGHTCRLVLRNLAEYLEAGASVDAGAMFQQDPSSGELSRPENMQGIISMVLFVLYES